MTKPHISKYVKEFTALVVAFVVIAIGCIVARGNHRRGEFCETSGRTVRHSDGSKAKLCPGFVWRGEDVYYIGVERFGLKQ
jgi:hypothetical protein